MNRINFVKIFIFAGAVVMGVFLSFNHSNAYHVGGHNPGHLFISGDRDYCFTMSGSGSGPDAGPYPRCTTEAKDWYWSTMVEGTWTINMDTSYIPAGWTVSGSGICYNGGGTNCSVYVTFTPPAPVYGCTDPSATNYNPSATVNDGSCTYKPPAPTVFISASPSSVAYNGISTISWSVSGSATQCYAGGSYPTWQGAIGTSGYSSSTNPLTRDYTFTVRCDGPGGSSNTAQANVTVQSPSPPTAYISASPGNVAYNGISTISWSVSGSATQCYAGGSYPTWQGAIGTSGYSSSTNPLTRDYTFTVRCDGPGGSSNTAQANVTVQPKPNQVPGGFLDDANCSTISGWAYDPDAPSTSINVHIYKEDGTVWGYTTDVHRGDVNAVYGISGNHGFSVATPDAFKDGKTHTVTTYAIDSSGGANPQLSNSPKSIYCPPPIGTIIVNSVDIDTGQTVTYPDGILSRENPDYQWTKQGWPYTYTGTDGMAYGKYNVLLPYTETSTHIFDHTDPPIKQILSSGQQTITWTILWKNKTPTASITCNGSSSTNVSYGGSARIDWTSNAKTCTVSPTGWSRSSGSETVTNLTSPQYTYTLTCNN